jgi:hypothetical protein
MALVWVFTQAAEASEENAAARQSEAIAAPANRRHL